MKTATVRTAFKKMRKRGIVTPTLSTIDMTTKAVSELYAFSLSELEKDILNSLDEYNVEIEGGSLVRDSLESLIAYLARSGSHSLIVQKLMGNLDIIINKDQDLYHYEKLKKRLKKYFGESGNHFFNDLFDDGDTNTIARLTSYALEKDSVFQSRIENIKELFINNAIERINGEQNELKKNFLQQLTDWSTGKIDELNVKDVIKDMKKTSVREARFFARDQMLKFNKALLIASFRMAGVKKVMIITCQDNAVRNSHKSWDNKTFPIDNIPNGWYTDYNCRCGCIAIWE
jgi:SPP1 gp7 family putative phage head morphogenesis protein